MLSTKLKEAAGNSADATLYVDDVFSTWLYTGNGSTQTITNGIDLAGKGGMVWAKDRNNANGHVLVDSGVGLTKYRRTNSTAADSTTTAWIFNSNGYVVPGPFGNVDNNVSWTFRKAAKFFDVVTYTGTGSARTIAHSLGVAPGMIIVKRTNAIDGWQIYHQSLGNSQAIRFSTAAAVSVGATYWQTTTPTSTEFYIGTDSSVNGSGSTYVAYLYAHDTSSTGIIQCGSLTTNGAGQATANLGWEPQFVIAKLASTADAWFMADSIRAMPATVNQTSELLANTSDAEDKTANNINFPAATGFSVTFGAASATVIYMAIRRPNKPPTTGTQVFSPIVSAAAAGTPLTTNFAVDMQMMAYRAGTVENSSIVDRLRGVSSTTTEKATSLRTSATGAEYVSPLLSQLWNNTGFNLPSGISGGSDIFWCFKRAPGFFDEVCYTGTGVATTQAHNLGVAPEMMIIKSRSNAFGWSIYNISLGNASAIYLNSTSAAGGSPEWNSTTPTSTVFSISNAVSVNGSGNTYVAYLFATLAGISKVGSYTGNGTGQDIACGFGSGGARFVLIKRTDAAGNWYTFDSARGLTSGSSPYLLLNSIAAEVTGNNGVYASSSGFTLGATASTTTNIASATYIYLSVA
jgi:hypothetical protein